ncbi:hypothetical protein [Vibrio sp. 1F255]|uniref:hypothetical protein n=1 Tax=Vibrio sp. 1F255 TaxID=3230009 RepID=UPI00352E19A1
MMKMTYTKCTKKHEPITLEIIQDSTWPEVLTYIHDSIIYLGVSELNQFSSSEKQLIKKMIEQLPTASELAPHPWKLFYSTICMGFARCHSFNCEFEHLDSTQSKLKFWLDTISDKLLGLLTLDDVELLLSLLYVAVFPVLSSRRLEAEQYINDRLSIHFR